MGRKRKHNKKMREQEPVTLSFAERVKDISYRYYMQLLSATLIIALILRILALLSLERSIYFDFLLWDERVYHAWAINIIEGNPLSSYHGFAPLPAYIMAVVYKIFSPDILYIRYLNIFFGVFTCYLVYLIGKEMANRAVGLFACLISCLYKPFIFYSIVPLKTALSVFLFAFIVYLFMAALNRSSMVKTLLLGIFLGLMLNVRPNCLVLIPIIPGFILLKNYWEKTSLKNLLLILLLFITGVSIAISPFIGAKYRSSGEFKLTTGQAGYAFYLGNNLDNPDPYYRPAPFASSSPFEQGTQMIIEASRRVGKKLSSREVSRYWTNQAIKGAVERPFAFIRKVCQKVLVLFNRFEAGDHYQIGFMDDFVRFFKVPFPGFWLILPFAMAGIFTAGFRSIKLAGASLILFFYASTMVLFFTSTRFRLPLLVILIPFAVMGIQNICAYIENGQLHKIIGYFVVLVLFFIVEFLPVQATGDMSAYYNTHATALNSMGFEKDAIKYWEKSSELDEFYSDFANLSLAGRYYNKGDAIKGSYYLDKITDDSFAATYKYELTGDILSSQGNIGGAISAYEKSLDINSGRREVRSKLIKLYWKKDKQRALQEYDTLEYISSFYDDSKTN